MNSKKCKKLRHLAEELTIGQPYRAYISRRTPGKVTTTFLALYPKAHPNCCTRGVYRQFKKLDRRNNPDEARAYLSKFSPQENA